MTWFEHPTGSPLGRKDGRRSCSLMRAAFLANRRTQSTKMVSSRICGVATRSSDPYRSAVGLASHRLRGRRRQKQGRNSEESAQIEKEKPEEEKYHGAYHIQYHCTHTQAHTSSDPSPFSTVTPGWAWSRPVKNRNLMVLSPSKMRKKNRRQARPHRQRGRAEQRRTRDKSLPSVTT